MSEDQTTPVAEDATDEAVEEDATEETDAVEEPTEEATE